MKTLEVKKPWGQFDQFTLNEPTTVKILYVAAGEEFSLQYHNHRTEFWRVLSGTPEITVGDLVVTAKAGDEFEIPAQTKHRISAASNDVEVLEITHGEFNENDIVRLEDKYDRA